MKSKNQYFRDFVSRMMTRPEPFIIKNKNKKLGFKELYVVEYPKNSRGSWS